MPKPSFLPRHRLDALVDAVLAITMTLLVLELRLPHGYGGHVLAALDTLMPKIIAWVVSFLLLGLFWQAHVRAFRHVEHIDSRLFWLTLLWLMTTSLVPFTSSLIGEHGEFVASHVLYGANLIVIEVLILVRNFHLRHHPELLEKAAGQHPWAFVPAFSLIACALGSMAVATVDPDYASAVYILIVPLRRIGARIQGSNSYSS